MKKIIKSGWLFPAILLSLCTALLAADARAEDIWTRDKLSGDWWGLRTDMADHGVKHELRFTEFYQDVSSGGRNRNSEFGGKFDYILNIDGQKLGMWPGFFVTMHAETQFGHSIIFDAGALSLPNTSMLYPLPNENETALTGLLIQQALSKNFVLAAGKINIVDLWGMAYPDMGVGVDGFMNTNMLAAALPWFRWVPLSVLGAGALALRDDGQIQGGLLVLDTHNATTTSGFDDLFDDGGAYVAMWRFFFDLDSKPGSLLFAAGTSTRDYNSLDKSDWTYDPPLGLTGEKKDDAWTASVYYEQIIWQADENHEKKLRLFTGWSLSDGNPSFGKWGGYVSVEGWGLIPKRGKDRMGVGGYFNQLSSDLKDLTSTLGVDLDNLWGAELYYNAEFTPWLHVTADVQLTANQNKHDDTATILGMRAVINF